MFRLVTEKTENWVRFLSAIRKITDEACFHIASDRIWLRGMDAAHVSLIDFAVPKGDFADYQAGEEESVVCILLDKLLPFLKKTKRGDRMEMIYDEKVGKFKVRVLGEYVREFITPLLDTKDRSPLKVPKVDYTGQIKMTTAALSDALKDIQLISEKVKISTTKETLTLMGETYEGIETTATLHHTDIAILEADIKEEATATYNVELMTSVLNEIEKISAIVDFGYGTDLPLRMVFEFPEEQTFDFYLAPRIED